MRPSRSRAIQRIVVSGPYSPRSPFQRVGMVSGGRRASMASCAVQLSIRVVPESSGARAAPHAASAPSATRASLRLRRSDIFSIVADDFLPTQPSMRRAISLLAGILALSYPAQAQTDVPWQQVEVIRTAHGVPHIRANNMRAPAYAPASLQLED